MFSNTDQKINIAEFSLVENSCKSCPDHFTAIEVTNCGWRICLVFAELDAVSNGKGGSIYTAIGVIGAEKQGYNSKS